MVVNTRTFFMTDNTSQITNQFPRVSTTRTTYLIQKQTSNKMILNWKNNQNRNRMLNLLMKMLGHPLRVKWIRKKKKSRLAEWRERSSLIWERS